MPFDLIAAKPATEAKPVVPGFEYYALPRAADDKAETRAAESALEQMFGYYR